MKKELTHGVLCGLFMMKISRKIGCVLVISLLAVFLRCGDKALFDELGTSRIEVVLKGTYESNNPRDWTGGFPEDDSVDDDQGELLDEDPTRMMLDIAELKVAQGKQNQEFANYRKTFSFSLDDIDPFFSGEGVSFKNDDVRPDFYWHTIKMYIRKMIFDKGKKYHREDNGDSFDGAGTWVFDDDLVEIFEEDEELGYDLNRLQLNTYYDSLRTNSSDINRIFPLNIPIIDSLVFDNEEESTVLEIRLVVKNFIKKYEIDSYSTYHYVNHVYGLSDWLRGVNPDETDIGGNILAVARSYVKGKTVTITGSVPAADKYVIAFSSSYSISDFVATPADRTRPACDSPKVPDHAIPGDLESILDYYLRFEQYKEDFNSFVDCVDDETYANEWEAYDEWLWDFLIPPLVTWSNGTVYELTNVPVGKTYYLYYADDPGAQSLPTVFLNQRILNVTDDMAGQTIVVDF
jgi:hypothetical protein